MKKLSFSTKLTYGIGDIASNFFIVTTGMFLLYFLIEIVGVDPTLAGIMLLFPKLWDVVSDPIMGGISDVTKTRFGRRRPYLLFGAIPFGLTFFIIFVAPHYKTDFANALHVALLFALGCTAFTVINVPYSSMVAEMSDDYNERMSITSFRMIFSSVGVLLAGGLAMPLVELGGGGVVNEAGFRFMGLVFGVIIVITCLVCFWGTRKAPSLPPKEKMPPIGEQIKIALRNFPFLMLMSSYFFQALAAGILMAGFIFYVKYAMELPETAMEIVFPIFLVTAIIFIPVWLQIGKWLGKITAYRIGLLFYAVMLGSLFFTGPDNVISLYVQVFLVGIGFSSFQLFPFSMLPDTIEYDEMQSGLRREGIFSGMWSSSQKIAYSLGPPIIGITLGLFGYVEGSDVQPDSVSFGVRVVFCIVTGVALLISFLPLGKYELTEERFEEIKKLIAKKRRG
jgi:GPH family glycoside/pentoside/hexuronide:cation symporter